VAAAGAGRQGASDDQPMQPGVRAVPATCPSGGSSTVIHGHSRSNRQRSWPVQPQVRWVALIRGWPSSAIN
jgi:hypothetical protein